MSQSSREPEMTGPSNGTCAPLIFGHHAAKKDIYSCLSLIKLKSFNITGMKVRFSFELCFNSLTSALFLNVNPSRLVCKNVFF